MFIVATIMLFFSFFAIISIGWADFCVNLDEFEADPLGSTLGQSIASFGGYGANGSEAIQIVIACWTGSDLLDVFNLSELLNWDQYRKNLTDVLNVVITKELQLDELDSLTTEINLLNTDEFDVVGDQYLLDLNALGGTCACQFNLI